MTMEIPGPAVRLGILVPSSNSNAEGITARMLKDQPDISVHYSRFPLPANPDEPIDRSVLGNAPSLLRDVEIEGLAFHGTSGSWTGLEAEQRLCQTLAEAVGAPVTTASTAMIAALHALSARQISVVFLGPSELIPVIQTEYANHDLEITGSASSKVAMSNQEIGRLDRQSIESLMRPAFDVDADAVVCIGTNLRSGYLAAAFEAEYGVPVIDSGTATLWHLLRIAGVGRPIPGWGRLMETG